MKTMVFKAMSVVAALVLVGCGGVTEFDCKTGDNEAWLDVGDDPADYVDITAIRVRRNGSAEPALPTFRYGRAIVPCLGGEKVIFSE